MVLLNYCCHLSEVAMGYCNFSVSLKCICSSAVVVSNYDRVTNLCYLIQLTAWLSNLNSWVTYYLPSQPGNSKGEGVTEKINGSSESSAPLRCSCHSWVEFRFSHIHNRSKDFTRSYDSKQRWEPAEDPEWSQTNPSRNPVPISKSQTEGGEHDKRRCEGIFYQKCLCDSHCCCSYYW